MKSRRCVTSAHAARSACACRRRVVGIALGGLLALAAPAYAIRSDSPEVRKLVESSLAVLERPIDFQQDSYANRLGGKCLMGLAFLKAGKPEHPRVAEAVQAVRASMKPDQKVDVYSNGIAIVFLCELDPQKYRQEIIWYLNLLERRQKPHGGWGYDGNSYEGSNLETGDTSQTQYASLGYWSAYRRGFVIPGESLERLAYWLLRTQDPSGSWGYQGTVAPDSERVKQNQTGCSMTAAGLGSTLICADLLDAAPNGLHTRASGQVDEMLLDDLPAALRPARSTTDKNRPPPIRISTSRFSFSDIIRTIQAALTWMDAKYEVDVGSFTIYYLYATERYQSFYELLSGVVDEEPKWYTNGYEYLVSHQLRDGGWGEGCGRTVDTAFAVLFLLRSTQKSIQSTLGEGTLIGGRGLPTNVARAKLRGNQVVVEQVATNLDQMLSMIDGEDQAQLDDLARDPASLVVDTVDAASARRLQQLVRGGEPTVRLLAVRALGRTGNLDYVPTLIYALTDPDRDVVLEARNALEFVSRRFDGFGPTDDFTDDQQFDAAEAWKDWYRSVRPGAFPEK